MARSGKSARQRRERAAARLRALQDFGSAPHSFVFARGRAGRSLRRLVADVRRALEPFTARALRVRKSNSLKDFVAVAGPLGVTHFLVFSKSASSINLKLFRLPGGPTLTFKVMEYSLLRDVVAAQRRHRTHEQQFRHPPLLVLSDFGPQPPHVRLMASTFQHLLPSINVRTVNLNSIRRCLLIAYDAETQLLHLRHYSVKVVPVGVSRGLKKLLQEKFPNMSRLEDISELLVKDLNLSESEAEQDGPHNVTELPQAYAGRGNAKAQQSAVRLTEIGPRLSLQLCKVEEGLAQGDVLYHGFIHKPEPEVRALLARREARLRLRAERRRLQEEALERKRRQRREQRERSLEGMRRKRRREQEQEQDGAERRREQEEEEEEEESDAEHYRREVGEEPEEDLFPTRKQRKRPPPTGPARLRIPPEHPGIPNPPPPGRSQRKLLPKGRTGFQRPGCARKRKR